MSQLAERLTALSDKLAKAAEAAEILRDNLQQARAEIDKLKQSAPSNVEK